MRIEAALALVFLIVTPAAAQVPFDSSVCRFLPHHQPAAGVEHRSSAEYQAGVDVHGNRVTPADAPGSAGAMPMDRFDIPVTLNFARRMGFSGFGAGMLPGAAEVGRLTLQGGRLAFNGQPIGDSAETQLYALCRTDR